MRAEAKQLDGPDLEREQRLEVHEAHEEGAGELPELAGEAVVDAALVRPDQLFGAVHAILDGELTTVDELHLPARAAAALEFLQTAVRGRDERDEYVFAEDRRSLLEQSLAVLQQHLTLGDGAGLAALHAHHVALTEKIATLRQRLHELEDAQQGSDHYMKRHKAKPAGAEPPGDDDGTADAQGDDDDDGYAAFEIEYEADGEGDDDDDDDLAPVRPPTTLGDPAEIAAAAAPWWRMHRARP